MFQVVSYSKWSYFGSLIHPFILLVLNKRCSIKNLEELSWKRTLEKMDSSRSLWKHHHQSSGLHITKEKRLFYIDRQEKGHFCHRCACKGHLKFWIILKIMENVKNGSNNSNISLAYFWYCTWLSATCHGNRFCVTSLVLISEDCSLSKKYYWLMETQLTELLVTWKSLLSQATLLQVS